MPRGALCPAHRPFVRAGLNQWQAALNGGDPRVAHYPAALEALKAKRGELPAKCGGTQRSLTLSLSSGSVGGVHVSCQHFKALSQDGSNKALHGIG